MALRRRADVQLPEIIRHPLVLMMIGLQGRCVRRLIAWRLVGLEVTGAGRIVMECGLSFVMIRHWR